jgi:hypothetical protein
VKSTRSLKILRQGIVPGPSGSSALTVRTVLRAVELARGSGELTATVWPELGEGVRPLPGAHMVDVGQRDARDALRVQRPARNVPERRAASQGPACNRPSKLIGKCVQIPTIPWGLRSCGMATALQMPCRPNYSLATRSDTVRAPPLSPQTRPIRQPEPLEDAFHVVGRGARRQYQPFGDLLVTQALRLPPRTGQASSAKDERSEAEAGNTPMPSLTSGRAKRSGIEGTRWPRSSSVWKLPGGPRSSGAHLSLFS